MRCYYVIIIYIYEASKISARNEKNRGNEIATERMEYIQMQLKESEDGTHCNRHGHGGDSFP